MEKIDVSIIIVNYNTKQLTSDCIRSIVKETKDVSYEIILVDNASTDGSVELFKEDSRIRFIQSKENLGFGKANNLGYAQSKGKYVFLLNSDTLLLNNAVKLFFDKMESSDEKIGCMGCLLQDAEGNYVHSYADFPRMGGLLCFVWSLFKYFVKHDKMVMDDPCKRKGNPHFFPVEFITGADLFVKRSVIEKCGLFDPDFFMYYEDPEMEWRYAQKGYERYIYDAPKIVHLEGKSFSKNNKKFLVKFRSRMLFYDKTRSRWQLMIIRFLFILKYPFLVRKFHFDSVDRRNLWNIINLKF